MGLQTQEIEMCFAALRSALQKAEESLKNLATKHEEKQEKDAASLKARAEASEREAKVAKEAQREAEERDERTQEKLQKKRDEAKELSEQVEKLSGRLEEKRQEYVRLDEYVTKLQDRYSGRKERPPEKRSRQKGEDRSRTPRPDRRSDSEGRSVAAASTMEALEGAGGDQKNRERSPSRSPGGDSRGGNLRGGDPDADSRHGEPAEPGAESMQLALRAEDAAIDTLDDGGRGDDKPISRQRDPRGAVAEDDRAPIPRRGRPEPPRGAPQGDIPRGADRQDEQRRSRSRSVSRPVPGPITEHWKGTLLEMRHKWKDSLAESKDQLEVDLSREFETAVLALRAAELPIPLKQLRAAVAAAEGAQRAELLARLLVEALPQLLRRAVAVARGSA